MILKLVELDALFLFQNYKDLSFAKQQTVDSVQCICDTMPCFATACWHVLLLMAAFIRVS